jgi:hypothetical protein
MLPGGGQAVVGIQSREQPAARPDGLPPQREHGGLTTGRHFQEMHPRPAWTCRPRRPVGRPGPEASKAIIVGSLRRASQRSAASQIREPSRCGREAQIQQHLASYEHVRIRPGKITTLLGIKAPTGRHAKGVFEASVTGAPASDPGDALMIGRGDGAEPTGNQERLRRGDGALHRVLSRPRRIARYSPHYAHGGESTVRIGYRL